MSFEQEMRAALDSFVVEGRELVDQLESGLLGLESDADGPQEAAHETVNAVFRAAHTIKGSAGLFGLDHIVRFTHAVESVLDRVRNDEISVTSELIGALLPCSDHLGRLMGGIAEGNLDEDPADSETATRLLAGLRPFLAHRGAAASPSPSDASSSSASGGEGEDTAASGTAETGPDASGGPRRVHLSLRFGSDSLRNGMDPLAFIRYLSTLGEIVSVVTLTDFLPEAPAFDAETCYLAFEVTLQTEASLGEVADVFEFVRDSSSIVVLGPESPLAEWADLVREAGELGPRIREVLVATGAVEAGRLDAALSGAPADAAPAGRPSGDRAAAGGAAGAAGAGAGQAAGAKAAGGKATAKTGGKGAKGADATADATADGKAAVAQLPAQRQENSIDGWDGVERRKVVRTTADGWDGIERRKPFSVRTEAASIRIDAARLDRLIDAVGELVIAGASAELGASRNRDEALLGALGEVMRLVEEVRDSALQLRMVPIGTTFSRFPRVVRDVSASLGKDIGLIISGGDTEVDKALVEQIGDPLMHLVRNAMDHGIEPADVRVARGKPARGTLRLNAYHDSGSIVIEVTDDGGGIDVERVRGKAIERGLIEPGAALTDHEIANLVFEPGFSTAESVSDLSGRGVGMDVVMRNVTALRGTIDIENRPGEGCTFRIRLPLTLAIIDGFMVAVGGATFVIPLDWVVECVELPPDSDTRDCMALRGEVLPFIRLRQLFTIRGERPRRENVVVVEYAGMKIGLVVDNLMGEFQTVIKPLGKLFGHVQAIGGATILGNGEVALIIDVPLLARQYTDRDRSAALAG